MAEPSDLNDDRATEQIGWRILVGREASVAISALVKLQVEMVDAGRVPRLRGCGGDFFEVDSHGLLEGWLTCISIHVDCRPVPVSGSNWRQWLIMEMMILRTCHDLDISDRVVIEQISMHVAIVLHVAGKQLTYSRCMHWLRWEGRCDCF